MKFALLFRRRWLWLYLPVVVLSALGLWLSVNVWLPLPPRSLVIAGGLPNGSYITIALRYRALLEARGINAQAITTGAISEPLKRLQDPTQNVQAAFAQGLLSKPGITRVQALATIERNPVWIFTRSPNISQLSQLKGLRIATIEAGESGWEVTQLLQQHAQLQPNDIVLVKVKSNAAGATELTEGRVDALVMVAGGQSESVRLLLREPSVSLMGIDRVSSFAAREPRLKPFVIPQGAIELRGDIPSRDLTMVATHLHLLVDESMHPALQRALLDVAREVHELPSFLQRQGEFPNSRDLDFEPSPTALALSMGNRPWIENLLPYWWAQLAELLALAVLPILLITILILTWIPSLFNWKINAVLQNFYGELKFLETDIEPVASGRPIEIKRLLQRLDDIEAKVSMLDLPNSHANRWYTLREHIARARHKLLNLRAR
jgi:NMT1/THI5 like